MVLHSRILVLVASIIVIAGCGRDDGATPENLGRAVARALRRNDFEAYLRVCGTPQDWMQLLKASSLSDQQKQEMIDDFESGQMQDEIQAAEDARQRNFAQIAGHSGWPQAVVDRVVVGRTATKDGILFCDVCVTFRDKAMPNLMIDDVVKTAHGWKTMDDVPLSFEY